MTSSPMSGAVRLGPNATLVGARLAERRPAPGAAVAHVASAAPLPSKPSVGVPAPRPAVSRCGEVHRPAAAPAADDRHRPTTALISASVPAEFVRQRMHPSFRRRRSRASVAPRCRPVVNSRFPGGPERAIERRSVVFAVAAAAGVRDERRQGYGVARSRSTGASDEPMAAAGGCDEVQAGRRPVRRGAVSAAGLASSAGSCPVRNCCASSVKRARNVATVPVRTAQVDLRVFVVIVGPWSVGVRVDLRSGRIDDRDRRGRARARGVDDRSSGPVPITSATSPSSVKTVGARSTQSPWALHA